MPIRLTPGTALLILAALLATALAGPAAATAAEARVPIKSPGDPRAYAWFTLPNGLQALVVSDPDTDKAAAALNVAVGSAADPADRAGLAHFLEHMLFLGTGKYPQAGEYQQFISSHGGSHNAYTAFEHTNYFFDIDSDHLEAALERFSRFFIDPLFNPEYVEREKNAVHSEYQAKLEDDRRRTFAVMQQVVNPRHPLSTFSVGSLQTLADRPGRPVREDLLHFYREHYSAGRMTVAVLGREPVPVLQRWVAAKFGAIPNRDTRPAAIQAPMFAPGTLPLRLDVTPIKDQRSLTLSFPVPALKAHYRSKPADYLANLLGHEGEGSILSLLERRGWADALSAGAGIDHRDGALFSVNIALTRRGLEHVDAVAATVFEYLRLIAERDVEQWRFDEQARLYDVRFRFKERAPAIEYVSQLAADLQHYPPEDVLRAAYLADRFDAALIRDYLARLTPDNVLMAVVAPGLETDRVERWYGTAWARRPLAQATLTGWRDATAGDGLMLPAPNVFIPENLALEPLPPQPDPVPRRLDASPRVELWHHQDPDYREPRASLFFSVRAAAANDSAEHAVLTELYVRTIKDQLNEFAYPATLAGLSWDLYRHVRGFTVKLSGFDDKQALLLEAIAARLRAPVIDEDRFTAIHEQLGRDLDNTRKDLPYARAMNELNSLLVQPHFTIEQRLAALEGIDAADLRAFVPELLRRIYVVALSHGNVTAAEALDLAALLERELLGERPVHAVPPAQLVKLEAGDYYGRMLALTHPDSALAAYYQGPDKRLGSRALAELLGQMVSAPFYNELRTERQLGYVVHAGSSALLDVPGLAFIVQSPVADPGTLETHVQAFLHDFRTFVAHVDETTFATHQAGVITRILEAEDRLRDRSDRYWNEIDFGYTRFDSRERLAAAVAALGRQDLLAFYDRVLLGPDTRRLSVRARGENHAGHVAALDLAPAFDAIESAHSFGQGLARYAPGAFPNPDRGRDSAPAAARAP